MMRRPFYSVGLLWDTRAETAPRFLGTCFAFRQRTHWLTAAHCVGTLGPGSLGLRALGAPAHQPRTVRSVTLHPTADLALLTIDDPESEHVLPFWDVSHVATWGDWALALGFPEDSQPTGGIAPTARFFTAHVQRFFEHVSHLLHPVSGAPFEYMALELSIGAPAGLSGGPVFSAGDEGLVFGLVAENHESTTYLHSVEEVQDGGQTFRELVHRVIAYSVCVSLRSVIDWLNEHVAQPPR